MKSLAIVNLFHEMFDRGSHLGECFVVVHVDLFVFERAHKALGFGVVIRLPLLLMLISISFCLQERDVISGRILHALIRMMDPPRFNRAGVQRHLQCRQS